MSAVELVDIEALPKSRLAALLEHLSVIEDVRELRRVNEATESNVSEPRTGLTFRAMP